MYRFAQHGESSRLVYVNYTGINTRLAWWVIAADPLHVHLWAESAIETAIIIDRR